MGTVKFFRPGQANRHSSPWTVSSRVKMLAWEFCWNIFCQWTPKPLNEWRLLWLKLFGAEIKGRPFVHQRARIQIPWNITLEDKSAIGDRTNLYSLDRIIIGAEAVIAQEAYLCTGTHDHDGDFSLMTAPIIIGPRAFIAARAFVMPGITVEHDAVVGAGSVVTKDVLSNHVVAGNPAATVRVKK